MRPFGSEDNVYVASHHALRAVLHLRHVCLPRLRLRPAVQRDAAQARVSTDSKGRLEGYPVPSETHIPHVIGAFPRPQHRTAEAVEKSKVQAKWSAFVLFGSATFLFWAALYLYVPILPSHAESQGASLPMVGAVIASYAIAQLLLRAPIGIWADSMGRRKPFVVAGLLVASLGALVLAVAPSPWFLFAGRTITGVAAATWVISTVFFASYFPAERTARGIGIISAVNGVAMVVATLLGGQLASLWGVRPVFFIATALGLLGTLLLFPLAEPVVPRARAFTRQTVLKVSTHPPLLMASAMSVLVHFAGAATISSFTLVFASRMGASSADLGFLSATNLAAATLATLGAVFVIERWGYYVTVLSGAAIMAITLLVTPLMTGLQPLEGLQVINGVGRGMANVALMSLSIRAVAPDHRATAMGVYQALYSIGMLAGPIMGGVVGDRFGLGSVFYMAGGASLLAACLAFGQMARGR